MNDTGIGITVFNDPDEVRRVLVTKHTGRRVTFRILMDYKQIVEPEHLVNISMYLGLTPVEFDVQLLHAVRRMQTGKRSHRHGND